MKTGKLILKIFFLLTILLSSKNTIAQSDDVVYSTAGIEVKPSFPGGMNEFYKFIGKNFRTPKIEGLQGKVYVTFVIEKDGSLIDIKVLRDIGYGTGEEAIRVLKECPKWSPGIQNGKPVRVLYSLPIAITPQKKTEIKEPIYGIAGIDKQPNFIGGKYKLNEYIQQNYKTLPDYPKGNLLAIFVVEKDGTLTGINVSRELGTGPEEEAIRVLKECQKWEPGEQNGKKVRVLNSLTINVHSNK